MTCPQCHIAVATHDPEKVVRPNGEFHGSCFRASRKPEAKSYKPTKLKGGD